MFSNPTLPRTICNTILYRYRIARFLMNSIMALVVYIIIFGNDPDADLFPLPQSVKDWIDDLGTLPDLPGEEGKALKAQVELWQKSVNSNNK